jgi:MHS family alpha-ketoglutarate permease-like MFS transporter
VATPTQESFLAFSGELFEICARHRLRQRHARAAPFALISLGLAVVSFYTGISGIVKAELFPTNVRALGVGLSYAVANATFGGTAEFVALWFKDNGMESTFFWYVTVLMAVAFVASLIMPNPKVHGYLDGAGTVEEALGKKPRLAHA